MRNSNGRNAFSMTISFLVVGGLTFLMNSMPASADENVSLHGKTIAELSAGWWEWQEENYPGFNFGDGIVDCSLGQKGPVWYLGGTGGGSDQRTCHAPIKGHKHLMFPLVNVAMFNPDDWCEAQFGTLYCTVEQKREILDGLLSENPAGIFNSKACLPQADVDGVPAVYSASIVRTQSPPFPYAEDPEAVADGFWVVLPLLSRGEHTVHFTGGLCDVASGEAFFSVDVTYDLTVK
jgi:hypothetical protein